LTTDGSGASEARLGRPLRAVGAQAAALIVLRREQKPLAVARLGA
jgi:hypothetical protein